MAQHVKTAGFLLAAALVAIQPAKADFIKFIDTANGVPIKIMNFGSGTITLMNGAATMYFQNKTGKSIGDFEFSWVGDENNYDQDGGPFFKYSLFNKTSVDFYKQDKQNNPMFQGTGIPNNQLFTIQIQFNKNIPTVTYEPTEATFPPVKAPEPSGLSCFLVTVGGLGLVRFATMLRRPHRAWLKKSAALPA